MPDFLSSEEGASVYTALAQPTTERVSKGKRREAVTSDGWVN